MKTILVAINATYNHTNLAVRYIERYFSSNFAHESSCSVSIKEFSINDDPDKVLSVLCDENADIYAFSCYIWNISHVLKLTSDLNKIIPGAYIILGGPEVSYEDASFFETYAHISLIIRGPGEKTLYGIMTGAKPFEKNKIIDGEPQRLMDKPFPYRIDTAFEKGRQYYYETSSGCPFSCSYCLSGTLKGVDPVSIDRVRAELDFFVEGGASIIKLVDRTFNYDDKRACEIWEYLIGLYERKPFRTVFHFEISADLLTERSFEILRTAPKGIFRFECGVQSANKEVLRNVHRQSDLDKILINIKRLTSFGNIEIHADLIAGLPGENIVSIADSFNKVCISGVNMVQLGFLKVLKGSQLRKQASEFGIIYSDFPPYRVLSTNELKYKEIRKLHDLARMTEIFRNTGNFIASLDHLCSTVFKGDHFRMLWDLSDFYRKRGGAARAFSSKDNILTFLEFGYDRFGPEAPENRATFRDLLKYDKYRYDARSCIAELDMNMSSGHPDLNYDVSRKLPVEVISAKNFKSRCEKYRFDAGKFEKTGELMIGTSFVIYNISKDRPEIVSVIQAK